MATLSIDSKYNAGLARFFQSGVLNDLVRKGYSAFFNEVVSVSGISKAIGKKTTLRDFLQTVYGHLCINYRNEYIYKNAIANNILLGTHSLNSSFMLTEFRVADCKADVVVINGTSNVYEIKSEFDSVERLNRQIAAYEKVFDMIHIITSPSQVKKVVDYVPGHIGIMSLSKRNSISTVRDAQSRKEQVSPENIFDSLRQPEYSAIIKEHYGYVPDVPNTQAFKVCRELFGKLPPEVAHDSMVKSLKKRGKCRLLKEFIETSPECLRAYTLNSGLNVKEFIRFKDVLNAKVVSFIR